MQHHAIDERQDLCATLRAVGPGAPTLCEGWTTSELAAHIYLRERSIAEVAGRLPVRRLQEASEREIAECVAREPYERIVGRIEAGPHWSESPLASFWSFPLTREAVNLLEYAIHTEDVRRANGLTEPRRLPIARQQAIWLRLRYGAPLTMARLGAVKLVWPSHGEIKTLRAWRDEALVTITGDPVELALVAFGRQPAAHVDYDGSPRDVERVRGARIAI